MWSWDDYARCWEVALPRNLTAPQPGQWHSDSRTIAPGQWFYPLKGENFDGHKYIAEALVKGASGFLYALEAKPQLNPADLERGIGVPSPWLAVRSLAKAWRLHLGTEVIAISGSVGKTSCREVTRLLLEFYGPTLTNEANHNNELGVCQTLLRMLPEHRFVVLECGARHPGDLAALVELSRPQVRVLLNARQNHVEIFGSEAALLRAKLELLGDLAAGDRIVLFQDQVDLWQARPQEASCVGFGHDADAVVRIVGSEYLSEGGMEATIAVQGAQHRLFFGASHYAYPLHGAAGLGVMNQLGLVIPPELDLRSFRGLAGRFRETVIGDHRVIDDCYNASPASMLAGLRTLAERWSHQPKVLVLGEMGELGAASFSGHRDVGKGLKDIPGLTPSFLVTIGDGAKAIAECTDIPHQHFSKVEELLAANPDLEDYGEILYFKGSLSVGLQAAFKHYCARLS